MHVSQSSANPWQNMSESVLLVTRHKESVSSPFQKLESRKFTLHSAMKSPLKPLALYVHVPFCKAKCTYCDFYSLVGRESSIPEYLSSLLREIECRKRELNLSSYEIDTIFFGGGTPNLLRPADLELIMGSLQSIGPVSPQVEIGMEINPGEADYDTLKDYKSVGINRISIGMQSFQAHLLQFMSRIHSVEKSVKTYDDVRHAGFTNVSGDLIYAVPGQTRQHWEADLRQLVRMAPEHISTYSLTVEEGTALHRWVAAGHVDMLEETIDTGMYRWGREYLESAGYQNYEISNYALDGFQCRHNMNYWRGVEYLGFGPAAHSLFKNRRHWNMANLDLYLAQVKKSGKAEAGAENIDKTMAQNEMIMTRLRLAEGLDLREFADTFDFNLLQTQKSSLEKWSDHVTIRSNHLIVNPLGWSLIDEISSDFMSL